MLHVLFTALVVIVCATWLVKLRVIVGGIVWLFSSGKKFGSSLTDGEQPDGERLLKTIVKEGGGGIWPWGVMDCHLRLELITKRKMRPVLGRILGLAYSLLFRLPGLVGVTIILCLVAFKVCKMSGNYLSYAVVAGPLLASFACFLVIIEAFLGFKILGSYAAALHVIEKPHKALNRQLVEFKVFVLLLLTTMVAASVSASVGTDRKSVV